MVGVVFAYSVNRILSPFAPISLLFVQFHGLNL